MLKNISNKTDLIILNIIFTIAIISFIIYSHSMITAIFAMISLITYIIVLSKLLNVKDELFLFLFFYGVFITWIYFIWGFDILQTNSLKDKVLATLTSTTATLAPLGFSIAYKNYLRKSGVQLRHFTTISKSFPYDSYISNIIFENLKDRSITITQIDLILNNQFLIEVDKTPHTIKSYEALSINLEHVTSYYTDINSNYEQNSGLFFSSLTNLLIQAPNLKTRITVFGGESYESEIYTTSSTDTPTISLMTSRKQKKYHTFKISREYIFTRKLELNHNSHELSNILWPPKPFMFSIAFVRNTSLKDDIYIFFIQTHNNDLCKIKSIELYIKTDTNILIRHSGYNYEGSLIGYKICNHLDFVRITEEFSNGEHGIKHTIRYYKAFTIRKGIRLPGIFNQ